MSLVRWPEIEQFYSVRQALAAQPSLAGDRTEVTYRAKVKLHGTNAAVQVLTGGEVEAQSRSAVLTPTSDNAGFARWVHGHAAAWRARCPEGTVVFGEWCGPGIQSGVAVNQLPRKVFAVFAASSPGSGAWVVDPAALSAMVQGMPDVFVLPWHGDALTFDWASPAEVLAPTTAAINAAVEEVERCDPWALANFGVRGVGEGLVYYPVSHEGREAFVNLVFKAKGEQHRVVRARAAAQVDPEVARGVEQFAEMVLTDARLEQGARAVTPDGACEYDARRIGAFLTWVQADVVKETATELEASGLTWDRVQRAVTDRARRWYLARLAR